MDLVGFKLGSWSQESQSEGEPVHWWLSPCSNICFWEKSGLDQGCVCVTAVKVTESPLKILSPSPRCDRSWSSSVHSWLVQRPSPQHLLELLLVMQSSEAGGPELPLVPGWCQAQTRCQELHPLGQCRGTRPEGLIQPSAGGTMAEEGNGHQEGIRNQTLTLATMQHFSSWPSLAAKSL